MTDPIGDPVTDTAAGDTVELDPPDEDEDGPEPPKTDTADPEDEPKEV
jgi:hypothetical protein